MWSCYQHYIGSECSRLLEEWWYTGSNSKFVINSDSNYEFNSDRDMSRYGNDIG